MTAVVGPKLERVDNFQQKLHNLKFRENPSTGSIITIIFRYFNKRLDFFMHLTLRKLRIIQYVNFSSPGTLQKKNLEKKLPLRYSLKREDPVNQTTQKISY